MHGKVRLLTCSIVFKCSEACKTAFGSCLYMLAAFSFLHLRVLQMQCIDQTMLSDPVDPQESGVLQMQLSAALGSSKVPSSQLPQKRAQSQSGERIPGFSRSYESHPSNSCHLASQVKKLTFCINLRTGANVAVRINLTGGD